MEFRLCRKLSTGEFVVRVYDENGDRIPSRDYFTNDRADAIATRRLMIEENERDITADYFNGLEA